MESAVVEIQVTYEGSLRTLAEHGPSGKVLLTDAPTDNRGLGQSFSPTDLVVTGLGACVMTILGIRAEERGVELIGSRARLEKHMVADPHRRIGRIVVEVRLPEAVGPEDRAALEEAARGCPVCRSLSPRVEVDLRFLWVLPPSVSAP